MKKRRNIFIAAAVFAIPLGVFAQTSQPVTTNTEQRNAKRAEIKTQAQEQRNLQQNESFKKCDTIQNRIDNRLNQYGNNNQMYKIVFENTKARLQRLAQRLQQRGYDVTKLKADIEIMSQKMDKLVADHNTLISKLEETKTSACGKTRSDFMQSLKDSRAGLQLVKQDRQEIKNFFQTTIKEDLMAIQGKAKEKAKANPVPVTPDPDITTAPTPKKPAAEEKGIKKNQVPANTTNEPTL